MKEQLRQEIERIWYRMQSADGGSAELERLGKLTVILRDLEAADASARYIPNVQVWEDKEERP